MLRLRKSGQFVHMQINGRSLEQVMHADAVRAFMFAGDTVKLEIQQAAYSYLMSHFAWAVKNTVRELWPASWFIAQYVVDYNITVWKPTKG
ncbi:hypothetical protein BaRGS_00037272 [Batillaria attramentaria]|uniref:Uncharacterized protein n=1 Tax=Batillaria attramentaria TaxID=370345 RepID=A0ABD0J9I8_9CAEN